MKRQLPLPKELWEQIPPVVQAALWVVIDGYERRSAAWEAEVAELKARFTQNSQHSSRPPSSDRPEAKRRPPRAPSGRKRGAQPEHPPFRRALVPGEQVKAVMACRPRQCRRCRAALQGSDPQPLRHQVFEVPPVTVEVPEYPLQRLRCAGCGQTTCGRLPLGVARTGYGPRVASVGALGTSA